MQSAPGFWRTLGLMALFFIVGFPLVAYIWHALNHLVAGQVVPRELLIAALCAVLLAGVLRLMARSIVALDAGRAREIGRHPPHSHGGAPHA
jgi:hypothetical protein